MITAINKISDAEYRFSFEELTRLMIDPISNARVGIHVRPWYVRTRRR
jgi:hypothetical protein